ncbi:hypothetical protein TNCV_2357411 [Trichonephila clavipes]|nr:hypothetical protein TNCV_2357411 [Trichonephila clavipes]
MRECQARGSPCLPLDESSRFCGLRQGKSISIRNCPDTELTPDHMFYCPDILAILQRISDLSSGITYTPALLGAGILRGPNPD